MLKAIIGTVVLALAGLFVYYYFADSSGRSSEERARDAGRQVLDTARDTAGGGAAKAQLTAALGMDASRMLHVWYDDGRVIVYGLAPEGVDEQRIRSALANVPGVSSIEVMIQPRPGYVSSDSSGHGQSPPPAGPLPENRKP